MLKNNLHNSFNKPILPANSVIGIFGGGQLGRMTCHAAQEMGYKTVIFSDIADAPASFVTNNTIVADYQDQQALEKFAAQIDIATWEFENIPLFSVELVAQRKPVYPRPLVLKITQNRLNEKNFLSEIGVKVTDFSEVKNAAELANKLQEFGSKAILKTATLGYDGKGQIMLETDRQGQMKNGENLDFAKIWAEFAPEKAGQMILEKFVPFQQEISVIAARNIYGETKSFPPLTNIHKNGILERSFYPAKMDYKIAIQAEKIAEKIISELDLIGLVAVEFFVLENGELLVNELAPRPHNSGHFSLDACVTNQFEQLIRAISGMKLGSTKFHHHGMMKNLIGTEVNELDEYFRNENAKIHLYGKKEAKPGRKMGHINILDDYPVKG